MLTSRQWAVASLAAFGITSAVRAARWRLLADTMSRDELEAQRARDHVDLATGARDSATWIALCREPTGLSWYWHAAQARVRRDDYESLRTVVWSEGWAGDRRSATLAAREAARTHQLDDPPEQESLPSP